MHINGDFYCKDFEMATVNETDFSDIYVIPDGTAYIWGKRTPSGLIPVRPDDYDEFYQALKDTYVDNSSYLLKYKGVNYRVERTVTFDGQQFCARKMPHSIPDIHNLGIDEKLLQYLISLSSASGLLLVVPVKQRHYLLY